MPLLISIPRTHSVLIEYADPSTGKIVDQATFTASAKSQSIWQQGDDRSSAGYAVQRLARLLSEQDQFELFQFYRGAAKSIKEAEGARPSKKVLDDVITSVRDHWIPMLQRSKLVEMADVMSRTLILVPTREDAAPRPQDTVELTYGSDDYYGIYTIAILCKVMSPVWNTLSSMYDQVYREIPAQDVAGYREMKLREPFDYVLEADQVAAPFLKLDHYARHVCERALAAADRGRMDGSAQTTEFLTALNVQSTTDLEDMAIANLLVRHLPRFTFDYADEDDTTKANIMHKVFEAIRGFTTTQMSYRRQTSRPKEVLRSSSSDSSRQQSVFDIAVSPMSGLGTQTMLPLAIDLAVDRFIAQYELNRATFDAMVEYYRHNAVQYSPFNIFVLSTAWRRQLPTRAIGDLPICELHKLISITQLVLLFGRFVDADLLCYLSCRVVDDGSTHRHPAYDAMYRLTATSPVLKEWDARMTLSRGRHSPMYEQMDNILTQICRHKNYVNLPPDFLQHLRTTVEFDQLIDPDDTFQVRLLQLGVNLLDAPF